MEKTIQENLDYLKNISLPDIDYYKEKKIKQLNKQQVELMYAMQYDDKLCIPGIDLIKKEGDLVYQIYCYKNNNGSIDYKKYLCMVYKDPNSTFDNEPL